MRVCHLTYPHFSSSQLLAHIFLAVADDNTCVRRIDACTMQVIVERVGGYVTDGADGRWRLNGQNVVGQRVGNIADLASTEERDCAMSFDQQWLVGCNFGDSYWCEVVG